jgi:hypothetical protein
MRTSIFLILVAFTLSLFGQGNTIDWRDGRPGVRVVTNSLQTGEIMGLIDVAGQAKAGTGDVARIEGELVTHTDDAAIHLTSNQVVRIAQEHGGGITNETDEIALAALASHRHDRIVIQMDETHTRWIDATNGVWEGGSFMTNYTGWAVVIDSPVNINGEIIGPCTNIAPGIPYPLWTNPADSGTVVKVEMFGYREPMAFQYWHRPGHASPNYLYFYGDSEDSSAMWQSNYMTSGSTNKVRDMLGTDDNGIWSWVSIVYGVHTQKVDYARHIGTLAMEGGGGITNEQDLAALRACHYGSPDIVESPAEWFAFDGEGTITAFNWEAGRENVVIPWAIGGVPVTAIGNGAFEESGIVSAIAPQTVTTIGVDAFYYCPSLTSINLPQATTIGGYAFGYCGSLASVSLPQATAIGDYAFVSCNSLTSINLPQATAIGAYAFSFCGTLASVSLPQAQTFGDNAFLGCTSLTPINLPQATTIGAGVFGNCGLLASVSLPQATTIGDSAFYACDTLTSVSLPQATAIGDGAFSSCYSLASVSLPQATSIGDYAFYYCPSLTSVRMGQNAPAEATDVFVHITPPPTVYVTDPQATGWGDTWNGAPVVRPPLYGSNVTAQAFTLGGDTITEWPVGGATNITDGVTSGTYSEATRTIDISNLLAGVSVELPDGIVTNEQDLAAMRAYHYGSPDIVESPAEWFVFNGAGTITAFNYQPGRENVVIPWAIGGVPVTTIGANAFRSSGIVSVIAPQTVTTIGFFAFAECGLLASVSLPQAQTVGLRAFYYCTSLSSVSLPQAQTVGAYPFSSCYSLASVSLPQATSIGDYAFYYCPSLTSVHMGQNAPAEATDVFADISPPPTVYVTDPQATGWGAVWNGAPVVRPPLYGSSVTAQAFTLGGDTITEWPAGGSAPYTDWTGTVTPQNGTATVTYAHGNMPVLVTDAPCVLTLDPTGYGTAGVSRVSLSYYVGTNSFTFATNIINYAETPTVDTNGWNTLLIRRVSNGEWKGVGL